MYSPRIVEILSRQIIIVDQCLEPNIGQMLATFGGLENTVNDKNTLIYTPSHVTDN